MIDVKFKRILWYLWTLRFLWSYFLNISVVTVDNGIFSLAFFEWLIFKQFLNFAVIDRNISINYWDSWWEWLGHAVFRFLFRWAFVFNFQIFSFLNVLSFLFLNCLKMLFFVCQFVYALDTLKLIIYIYLFNLNKVTFSPCKFWPIKFLNMIYI